MADLEPGAGNYRSSRAMFEVLIGEDLAQPIIGASCSGDATTLRNLLEQPEWIQIAHEKQHAIYYINQGPSEDGIREVGAMPFSNLERAVFKAAEHDQPEALSVLFDFCKNQDIKPRSVISRWTVDRTIISGRTKSLDVLASADRTVVRRDLGHGTLPLDRAVRAYQTNSVATLLRHGAEPLPHASSKRAQKGYRDSLLAFASEAGKTRMARILLEHGTPVAGSAALHSAANSSSREAMQLLVKHGADVDEQLTAEMLLPRGYEEFVGRTPLHVAAASGHVDAMAWLESKGARSDIMDVTGRTAAQVLEQRGENQRSGDC